MSEPDQYDGALAWRLDADHPVLYAETHEGGPICLTCDQPACDTCRRLHALWDCSWCKPCAQDIGCYPLTG
ncbi:hypothetical protein ACFWWT_45240 [Streptomyces sp. NPDC058676]|uniref:hypothetical protein n=1 Tax=unclassified Streptomyces TaxID=2593676 RepID=UPI00365F0D61